VKVLYRATSRLNAQRGKRLCEWLRFDGHEVRSADTTAAPPSDGGLALFEFGHSPGLPERPVTSEEEAYLAAFPGKVVLFSFEDFVETIPAHFSARVAERADAWLKIAHPLESERPWPFRGVPGFTLPFRSGVRVVPPWRWRDRVARAVFYGGITGPRTSHPSGNARAEVVRRMRRSGLAFEGGITSKVAPEHVPDFEELRAAPVPQKAHWNLLRRSAIALVVAGNHPLTKRYFEAMAAGALVMGSSVEGFRWLRGGLKPFEHYVPLRDDLADLEEKVAHYLARPAEAEAIARAGWVEYARYFHPGKGPTSEAIWRDTVASARGALPGPTPDAPGRGAWDGVVSWFSRSPVGSLAYRAGGFFGGWT